ISMGLLFFYLARNAWQQTISAGVFVLYLQTFQRVQLSDKSWMQALVGLYQQRLFLNHLFQFLDLPLLVKRGNEVFPLPLYKLAIQD
ncbi:hypothetical protein, partial [Acinetobacter baumannii]|uniref:hypothetical protein n=1 Tax=Acinetobacter baumannii TaxID=470 RepID=UPI001C08EE39